MRHWSLLLLPVVFWAAAPARADTTLDLSETGTVMVQPDELSASLRAQAEAPSPQAAQDSLNRKTGQALAAAHQVTGVRIATSQYMVQPPEPPQTGRPSTGWHASQTIDLSSDDGPALLALVGSLQQQGLAVEQLTWRLSATAERHARDQAMRQAVGGLRSRAESIATLLGLHFTSFKTVRIGPAGPRPMAMPMRALAATAMPTAESGPVEVNSTVTAEAVLTPPSP